MFITVTCSEEKCFITVRTNAKNQRCGRKYFGVWVPTNSRTKIIFQDFPVLEMLQNISTRCGNPAQLTLQCCLDSGEIVYVHNMRNINCSSSQRSPTSYAMPTTTWLLFQFLGPAQPIPTTGQVCTGPLLWFVSTDGQTTEFTYNITDLRCVSKLLSCGLKNLFYYTSVTNLPSLPNISHFQAMRIFLE